MHRKQFFVVKTEEKKITRNQSEKKFAQKIIAIDGAMVLDLVVDKKVVASGKKMKLKRDKEKRNSYLSRPKDEWRLRATT